MYLPPGPDPAIVDPALYVWRRGARFVRCHHSAFGASELNARRDISMRFRPFASRRRTVPTIYGSEAITGALSETLLHLVPPGRYEEAQHELVRVAMPFMMLWREMEQYTGGDGYLDKLCMELVGLGSSRCRPPTRDVRDRYRRAARDLIEACGAPAVAAGDRVAYGAVASATPE